MKLKYQGGITRLICCKRAAWHKARFLKELDQIKLKPSTTSINFEVLSLAGSKAFEDQVLSIYSFIYYAGQPTRWTVYNDGSFSKDQIQTLHRLFNFVTVVEWDIYPFCQVSGALHAYAQEHALAKKVNVILGHPMQGQTIYLDSDIIFYRNIHFYLKSPALQHGLWFVSDVLNEVCQHFEQYPAGLYPVNSGFMILNTTFRKEDVLRYFEDLHGHFNYFSEQSAFGEALRKQNAQLLDPRQFVNDTDDQFDFSNKFQASQIAMRHYTSPIRHKMWQNGWRWHFLNLNELIT